MSGGGAGLDRTSDANGPPQASRADTPRSRRRHGDAVTAMNAITAAFGRPRPTPTTIGTVATFRVTAHTLTVFIRCTSPGHPPFLLMNVYFAHRAGKLEGGAGGWIKVSSYSSWECLAR